MTTKIDVEHWQGFWWWHDPVRRDWFVGPHPSLSHPAWWLPSYRIGQVTRRTAS